MTVHRVAWREGGNHKTEDHDTHDAAEAHEQRLNRQPNVALVIRYEFELLEETG